MKKISLCCLLGFWVFISLSGCRGCVKKPEKLKLKPVSNVVVLCDLSNSSMLIQKDNTSSKDRLNKLKAYVTKIPYWFELGTGISYYPIFKDQAASSMGPVIKYSIQSNSQLEPVKKKVATDVQTILHKIDSLLPYVDNSCIAMSIKRVIDVFRDIKAANSTHKPNELIIISDMLESCDDGDSNQIRFSFEDGEQLNNAISIFDNSTPGFSATDLDIEVTVILNTPGIKQGLNKVKSAWSKWFAKAGITRVHFFSTPPEFEENRILSSSH